MFMHSKKTNMELEILEQPQIVYDILEKYIDKTTNEIKIDLPTEIKKIVLVASGSSYHCARFAVDLMEKVSKIETRAIYSSEFLLKNLIPHDDGTLYIFITQSGETSDTIKSLERVKRETQLSTLCITNNENSTIWNLSDYKVACYAGAEQGIAATKSFSAQMLCLILISLKSIENLENPEKIKTYKDSLLHLPDIMTHTLVKRNEIKKLAKRLAKNDVLMITADGISYSLAKEAALKIKETSYKNISAAILGEFMHGHVAVLNNKKSIFIYMAVDKIGERSVNNINKIKEDYKVPVVLIGNGDNRINSDIHINYECNNLILQLFSNLTLVQLLALETALYLHRNVDHPKGLHKVVVDKVI